MKKGILTKAMSGIQGQDYKVGEEVLWEEETGLGISKIWYKYTKMDGTKRILSVELTIEGEPYIKQPFL